MYVKEAEELGRLAAIAQVGDKVVVDAEVEEPVDRSDRTWLRIKRVRLSLEESLAAARVVEYSVWHEQDYLRRLLEDEKEAFRAGWLSARSA